MSEPDEKKNVTPCAGGCGTDAKIVVEGMCAPCTVGALFLSRNALRLAQEERDNQRELRRAGDKEFCAARDRADAAEKTFNDTKDELVRVRSMIGFIAAQALGVCFKVSKPFCRQSEVEESVSDIYRRLFELIVPFERKGDPLPVTDPVHEKQMLREQLNAALANLEKET